MNPRAIMKYTVKVEVRQVTFSWQWKKVINTYYGCTHLLLDFIVQEERRKNQ